MSTFNPNTFESATNDEMAAARDVRNGSPTARAPQRPAGPVLIPDVLPVERVAERLCVSRADVMDLIRRGLLPAKRIGHAVVVTSAALAEYVSEPDQRAGFPRYESDQPVIVLDADGVIGAARFVRETPEGHICIRRRTLLGERLDLVYPSQVQPLSCRLPSSSVSR